MSTLTLLQRSLPKRVIFTRSSLLRITPFTNHTISTSPVLLSKHYTTAGASALTSSSKRGATSLANRSKAFGNQKSKQELTIINKKYSDDGKLLILDISENAVLKLNQLAKEEDNPNVALRIGVESGGCHGFQYNLELSDINTKTEDDCIFEKNGAKVIIDDSSLSILRESIVDYSNELIGSMFKVTDSPYTTSSCGCGSSFDFDFDKLSGTS